MTSRTFRSRRTTASALVLAVAFPAVVLALAAASAEEATVGALLGPVLVSAAVVALGLRVARMRAEVDERGVTVVAFLRTTTVAWPDVVGAVATGDGLAVLRAEGRPVGLHSLGRSVADDAAEVITAAADARAR